MEVVRVTDPTSVGTSELHRGPFVEVTTELGEQLNPDDLDLSNVVEIHDPLP